MISSNGPLWDVLPTVLPSIPMFAIVFAVWIPVERSNAGNLEFTTNIARSRPIPTDEEGRAIPTLSIEEVIEEVEENAEVLSWDDAMRHISELRLEHYREDSYFGFRWFGGYKPVYFLMSHDG